MSNPYDPVESDLRKQLASVLISLHEAKCKIEVLEREIQTLKACPPQVLEWLDGWKRTHEAKAIVAGKWEVQS